SYGIRRCENKQSATNKILRRQIVKFLNSLAPGTCSDIILNKTKIDIFSSKLRGQALPIGSFNSPIVALQSLYSILCQVEGTPTRPGIAISYDLSRVTYDDKTYLCGAEFTLHLTTNKNLTFFTYFAFDRSRKICGYDAQIRNIGITLDQSEEINA
ncbi:unnamed protein product, partial [Didymodactylos carnosus]